MPRRVPRDPIRARIETEAFPALRDRLLEARPVLKDIVGDGTVEDILDRKARDPDAVRVLINAVWEERARYEEWFQNTDGRVVQDRSEPLQPCNHSYDDAVMVRYLHACTRRHIKSLHDEWETKERSRADDGGSNPLARLFGRKKQDVLANDRLVGLYTELEPYLRHEWQFPLIPEYARLAKWMITELGELLLNIRDASALHQLADINPKDVHHAKEIVGDDFVAMISHDIRTITSLRGQKVDTAKAVLAGLKQTLGDRVWEVVADRERFTYAVHLRMKNKSDFRAVQDYFADLSPEAIDMLREAYSARRLAMFLDTAHDILGDTFREVFGPDADRAIVGVFINKSREIQMNDHYDNEEQERQDFTNSFSVICRAYLRDPQSFMAIKAMS